jgi:phosphoglycerate dehydrogenase-like enzyme
MPSYAAGVKPLLREGGGQPDRGPRTRAKVGVIGAGKIGGTLAARLVAAGHEVAISNSRARRRCKAPSTVRGR